jgi:GT2 family glycosyltransferase
MMTPGMKISWIILTHNRHDIVNKAFDHNYEMSTRCKRHNELEIIWVDNGSGKRFNFSFISKIQIINDNNNGVSRGYNQGLVLATGDYILITGCDRLMPVNYLNRMTEAFEKIPNMACVSCYSQPEESIQDRYITHKQIEEINGVRFMQALPFEARMFKRSLLSDVGYFHEGFGLYGWEDCLWGPRMLNVAKEKGLICCTLPDFKAEHLGEQDERDYQVFKDKQKYEPWKWELVQKLAKEGYPKFNPFL